MALKDNQNLIEVLESCLGLYGKNDIIKMNEDIQYDNNQEEEKNMLDACVNDKVHLTMP